VRGRGACLKLVGRFGGGVENVEGSEELCEVDLVVLGNKSRTCKHGVFLWERRRQTLFESKDAAMRSASGLQHNSGMSVNCCTVMKPFLSTSIAVKRRCMRRISLRLKWVRFSMSSSCGVDSVAPMYICMYVSLRERNKVCRLDLRTVQMRMERMCYRMPAGRVLGAVSGMRADA